MPEEGRRFAAGGEMRRCKLLYLIPSLRAGGAEIQLLSLVRGLDKSSFDPTVATFYRGGALDASFAQVPGLGLVFLNKKSPLDFRHLPALVRRMRRERYDVVQPFNLSARLIGVVAAAFAHDPITVVTERTARPLVTTAGSGFYLLLEKYAMRRASVVVTNSEAGRRFLLSRGIRSEKIRVIYNGVEALRIRPKTPADEIRASIGFGPAQPVVGMIARLAPEKDPLMFVRAGRRALRRRPELRFVLVGDGPLRDSVRDAVRAAAGEEVILTGYRENVADWLQIMDVVVLTSSRVEGCSNSILEAMALGKPVIATRVGGNRELIQDGVNGLLVRPRDPDALADAIERLFLDEPLRRRLAARGRETVRRRFSGRRMVADYQNLYQELIGSGRGQTEEDHARIESAR